MNRLRRSWLIALLIASFAAGGTVWAMLDAVTPTVDLASWVPQGALLSLETADFSSLLGDWTSSSEKAAWIKSDDYAVFSRSRLFGRLQEAQKDFASAASLPVDGDLLKELAGRQTFFSWYDIGELQIVYITRLTPAELSQSRLWQRRKQFDTRHAGGVTFYVKTSEDDTSDSPDSGDAQPEADDSATAQTTLPARPKKTVAFAESGDWLILATSEKLMAQSLELMAKKDHSSDDSLARQDWYKDARAAATEPAGSLRMMLNMERIVKTPQFRTYWIQQNVTEMKQYKAVVADLYREADGMREERVLLPLAETSPPADIDLGPMAALAPAKTAIFRATARPSAADAFAALQTKVLDRSVGAEENTSSAPSAALDAPQAGTAADLETRIDEPAVVTAEKLGSLPQLPSLLSAMTLQSMLTVDRHSVDGRVDGIWTPFASAVVLSSAQDWDAHALLDAVQQTVQTNLTVGSLGMTWQQRTAHGLTYFATGDAHGLYVYVTGHICMLADDEALLSEMAQALASGKGSKPQPAILLAGFDHEAARPGFAQWTRIVDGLTLKEVAPADLPASPGEPQQDTPASPVYFGKDIKSLSDAFAAMKQERFLSWHDGALVRQTITYTWQHEHDR